MATSTEIPSKIGEILFRQESNNIPSISVDVIYGRDTFNPSKRRTSHETLSRLLHHLPLGRYACLPDALGSRCGTGVIMQNWSITETYLARKTWNIETIDNEGACQAMQRFADQSGRNIGVLQFDDFSDEIHARFTRNGRTRIFMRIQYEGETK